MSHMSAHTIQIFGVKRRKIVTHRLFTSDMNIRTKPQKKPLIPYLIIASFEIIDFD